MTYGEAVHAARGRLTAAGIAADEAARDAELLARHASGLDRAAFLARTRDPLDNAWHTTYTQLIKRRAAREPVAYIRGVQEFWGRDFLVSPAVLIPRPETELIVDEALVWRRDGAGRERPTPTVVDVGTGSGCLAVTLAAECRDITLLATDISDAALQVASTNAQRHGVADRITFVRGSYLEPIDRAIDLIVANPPYVAERDRDALQPEVGRHEPATALFGGDDGLRDVRALVAQASERLTRGGMMLMEIGLGQEGPLQEAVDAVRGLSVTRIRRDLQGIARTAVIERVS